MKLNAGWCTYKRAQIDEERNVCRLNDFVRRIHLLIGSWRWRVTATTVAVFEALLRLRVVLVQLNLPVCNFIANETRSLSYRQSFVISFYMH